MWRLLRWIAAGLGAGLLLTVTGSKIDKTAASLLHTQETALGQVAGRDDAQVRETPITDTARPTVDTVRTLMSASELVLPVAGVTAFGYFIGWRYLYAYYASFGLDPAFFSFTVGDIVHAGWRIYVVFAAMLIVASLPVVASQGLRSSPVPKRSTVILLVAFYILILLGVALISVTGYLYWTDRQAQVSWRFHICAFTGLLLFWLAFVLGDRLHASARLLQVGKSRIVSLFRVAFPSRWLWLALIAFGFVVAVASLTSFLGWTRAKQDYSSISRLQIVTLYTTEPLSATKGELVGKEVWRYDDLRFLARTGGMYFVFRPEEVQDGIVTTYAVPERSVSELHLRSWYDKYPQSGTASP